MRSNWSLKFSVPLSCNIWLVFIPKHKRFDCGFEYCNMYCNIVNNIVNAVLDFGTKSIIVLPILNMVGTLKIHWLSKHLT